MRKYSKTILITGGLGFIGRHVVCHFLKHYPDYKIINLDAITYAGNLQNIPEEYQKLPAYTFVHANIRDFEMLKKVFHEYQIDNVIHLAAESLCRSFFVFTFRVCGNQCKRYGELIRGC